VAGDARRRSTPPSARTPRAKVAELDDAVQCGGKVLTGGHALDGPGYCYAPTVIGNVPAGSRVLTEEIFGPVAPVTTFSSEDEARRRSRPPSWC